MVFDRFYRRSSACIGGKMNGVRGFCTGASARIGVHRRRKNMANGEWRMANDGHGEWRMADGEWRKELTSDR
jgi:hypothetical protein